LVKLQTLLALKVFVPTGFGVDEQVPWHDILITEARRRDLDGEIIVRSLGESMAGTTRPLGIYEVVGVSAENNPPPAWLETFASTLEHFKKRELDPAEALFKRVSEMRGAPDDPSGSYLKENGRQRARPVIDSPWDGVIRLSPDKGSINWR